MAQRVLAGTAASPGVAAGVAHVLTVVAPDMPAGEPAEESRCAAAALEAAAAELAALAAQLDGEQAELVETAVLIAGDPGLLDDVLARTAAGAAAPAALLAAAEVQAELIAAIDDPVLAARADDVRSVGRRAARLATGAAAPAPDGDTILVADDLGPADVAELGAGVRGIALAGGAVTAHAAIVARSLGLPMVVGLGAGVLHAAGPLVVDGDAGAVVVAPSDALSASVKKTAEARALDHRRWQAARALPATTRDGHRVTVLANAASEAEVAVGLGYGAEGAGLIRTELAFLDAPAWPAEEQHRRALAPVLGALRGQTATVRVLDFGADKTPPFLAGEPARGIELLLRHPEALAAQLRAIVAAGRDCRLRVLVPMIHTVAELDAVAALLEGAAPLGAMVETPAAAAAADVLAARADFLSIGTNDLTAATLGVDRFSSGDACAHHPLVLAAIARTVEAAHAAGKVVEVCGEAASDPVCLPLLVGLGVDELSVGAARVGAVREWVRGFSRAELAKLAQRALAAPDAAAVAALVQAGDAAAQGFDGGARVAAVGA
jgi:phosphoenolpyruvate-protein kinase (PTS system EI component)